MMKTFKKKLAFRKYRERDQPEWRKGKGFLEKHVDYAKRAKVYHKKQDQLNLLRQKAQLKNPDEFYFKMVNARTDEFGDVQVREPGKKQKFEEVQKNIKTETLNIIKMEYARLRKRIERLEAENIVAKKGKLVELVFDGEKAVRPSKQGELTNVKDE